MKQLTELENKAKDNEDLRKIAMDIAQYFFSQSQKNLTVPMPWGDDKFSGKGRKPTTITDTGELLNSAVPPRWQDKTKIIIEYRNPVADYCEYGTPPRRVPSDPIRTWVKRKLGIRGKKINSVTWAIIKKIEQEGIPPHPFVRPAIDSTEKKFKLTKISNR